MYFVDTSALVKAYVREPGTEAVHHAMRELGGSHLFVSRLVVAETLGVLTRKLRNREIRYGDYVNARDDLTSHVRTRLSIVPMTEDLLVGATKMIDGQRSRGPGVMDIIHLSAAEYLQTVSPEHTVRFMCSDDQLGRLAEIRGFDVVDPATSPIHEMLPPDLGFG